MFFDKKLSKSSEFHYLEPGLYPSITDIVVKLTSWTLSCTVTEIFYTSKIMKLIWKWQKTSHFWQNKFISWATLTYSTSGALYWTKQLLIIKTNSVKNGCFFLISFFRLYPGVKKSFENNSVRKNLFLSACFCWDSRLSLREMDQKYKFGGTIGYGDSYLESLFHDFKVFRLHAVLHDAAGAVRAQSGKGPGYCYMIGRVPNSCLLGHVTGRLFCLYLNLFLPSIFNSLDFWSSMSLIVLDMKLTEKNIIKELGLYVDGSVQGFSFCPPKAFKPNKQMTCNTTQLHGIAWTQLESGDKIRISKYDLPFRKGYKTQFTKEVFEIVAISSRKPPTYTVKDEQDEIIRGKLYQKELVKVI